MAKTDISQRIKIKGYFDESESFDHKLVKNQQYSDFFNSKTNLVSYFSAGFKFQKKNIAAKKNIA